MAPATVLAVTLSLAWPLLSVTSVAPPGKIALAPLAGPLKVTLALETRLPNWSLTVATSGFENAVLTVALWPLPLVTAMELAAPGVFVRVKLAEVATPPAVAVMV